MTTLEHGRLAGTAPNSKAEQRRKVWDWPTRFFHWSLVIAFVGAFVTNKLGASYFTYHLWFGYAVIILVGFRIVWGFIGTRHARFASFIRGPRGVLRYVSAAGRGLRTRYAGHNPLGGLMVLTLLLALGAQATLGLFCNDEIFNTGPLASLVSKQLSLALTSLHRKTFYLIAAAVGLHIVAVLAHVAVKREPLIRAMFTGAKPNELVDPDEAIRTSKGPLAAFVMIIISVILATALHFAPQADFDLAGY